MIDGIPYKDLTFNQFTTWATRIIFDNLIQYGMRGVNEALYTILPKYVEYQKERTKKNAS